MATVAPTWPAAADRVSTLLVITETALNNVSDGHKKIPGCLVLCLKVMWSTVEFTKINPKYSMALKWSNIRSPFNIHVVQIVFFCWFFINVLFSFKIQDAFFDTFWVKIVSIVQIGQLLNKVASLLWNTLNSFLWTLLYFHFGDFNAVLGFWVALLGCSLDYRINWIHFPKNKR